MNKKFTKSVYFYISILFILIFIPMSLTLEWSKGTNRKGFFSSIIQVLESVDNKFIDIKFRLSPDKVANEKVVVVAIDENSLDKLGRWQSWSRENYAKTIAKLDEYGAKVVGFDVVFDSEDNNAGYQYLTQLENQYGNFHKKKNKNFAQALEQAKMFSNTDWMLEQAVKGFGSEAGKGVVLGYFVQGQTGKNQKIYEKMPKPMKVIRRNALPLKPFGTKLPIGVRKPINNYGVNYKKLSKNSFNHGYFSMSPDKDGVVRHYQIFQGFFGDLYPSLALKMMEIYFQTPVSVEKLEGSDIFILSMRGKKNFELPIPSNGQLRVHYYGHQNSMKTVSLADVLDENEEINYAYHQSNDYKYKQKKTELFKDALVLIGATAIGIYDVRNTPKQVNLPGVEVHASMLSQFLDNIFYRELADYELFLLSIVKALAILFLGFVIFKYGAFQSIGMTLGILIIYLFYDYYFLFKNFKIVYQTPFLLFIIVEYLLLNSYKYFTEVKEKQFIKNIFQNYVSGDVVDQMIEDPNAIKLGGESKVLSVLFTDIEGFSTISEKLSPEKLSKILNIYLTKMTNVIFENKGTFDKFIGDAIMCFWGAPVSIPNHDYISCKNAIEMLHAEEEINQILNEDQVSLRTRIGINTGPMAVGNMGSDTQFAYTVLGDSVNLAARLEGVNKKYGTQIIVSEFTRDNVKDDFLFRRLDRVKVVGKEEPVEIYELVAKKDEHGKLSELQIAKFELALQFYFKGEFGRALDHFNDKNLEHDSATEVFKKRCLELVQDPPKNWDGVWTLTSK